MFSTLLVANRGEIAVRAFRAAYELGIRTVAGSSTRGGSMAMKKCIDLLRAGGNVVCITPDGPRGPRIGAFFDFDGTVIDGYSLAAFARHHLRSLHVTPAAMGELLLNGLRGVTTEEDFERFTVAGMRAWAGRTEDELAELGERLFVQGIAGSLYPEAWRLVTAHLQAGHTVVLASSATRFQVEPAARATVTGSPRATPRWCSSGTATPPPPPQARPTLTR